jgi:hypothetical protein
LLFGRIVSFVVIGGIVDRVIIGIAGVFIFGRVVGVIGGIATYHIIGRIFVGNIDGMLSLATWSLAVASLLAMMTVA